MSVQFSWITRTVLSTASERAGRQFSSSHLSSYKDVQFSSVHFRHFLRTLTTTAMFLLNQTKILWTDINVRQMHSSYYDD